MFDSDFKAGKLKCHTWIFFCYLRKVFCKFKLHFCIFARVKPEVNVNYSFSLVSFKVYSVYNCSNVQAVVMVYDILTRLYTCTVQC